MLVWSFFVLILIIFIFGIISSKLKIVVKKLDFAMQEKVKSKNDYEIKLGIYLFGKIKIFGVSITDEKLNKLKKTKMYNDMLKKEVNVLDREILTDNIKCLDTKLEKVNLNVKLGTDSTLITSFLTFVVSTAVSFVLQKGITKYNPKKHKFIITPLYENRNNIEIYLELVASFKMRNVIKVLSNLNNLSKMEQNKNKFRFKEIKV